MAMGTKTHGFLTGRKPEQPAGDSCAPAPASTGTVRVQAKPPPSPAEVEAAVTKAEAERDKARAAYETAVQELNRPWHRVDVTEAAVRFWEKRLEDARAAALRSRPELAEALADLERQHNAAWSRWCKAYPSDKEQHVAEWRRIGGIFARLKLMATGELLRLPVAELVRLHTPTLPTFSAVVSPPVEVTQS